MSLLKLLSVGQSFAGAKNEPGRYKMLAECRLPQFLVTARSESRVSESQQPEASCAARRVTFVGRLFEQFRFRGFASVVARGFLRGRTAEVGRAKVHKTATKSSNLWFRAFGGHVRSRSFESSLVQAELELENVRVVRNDLSDTDLEIVAGRRRARAQGAAKTVRPRMDSLSVPDSRFEWSRMAARLFVAGQARFE